MKIQTILFFIFITIMSFICQAGITIEDYTRAEQFLPLNIDKLVFNMNITPNWINNGPSFWYLHKQNKDKKIFLKVDPVKNIVTPLFDHEKLATALLNEMNKTGHKSTDFTSSNLPFDFISFSKTGKEIEFNIGSDLWQFNLKTNICQKLPPKPPVEDGISPDEQWIVFTRDYNLFLRSVKTKEEFQLTTDGIQNYDYATPLPGGQQMVDQGTKNVKQPADVIWSPDSKRFITYRIDHRKSGKMHIIQSVPTDGGRPRAYSFTYPLPGEIDIPSAYLFIFEVESRKMIKIDAPPLTLRYYGNPWDYTFFPDPGTFYYSQYSRGYSSVQLRKVDTNTGAAPVIMEEKSDTYIDATTFTIQIFKDCSEMIWYSERNNWNHMYRYDLNTGKLKNPITQGPWVVREIVSIDEKAKIIYFTASGKEPNRNLYFRHLYRVNLDGSDLKLLTPENAEHFVQFSPDNRFFIDNYSTVEHPPVTLLRNSKDGKIIRILEKADIHLLLETGWKPPESFCVKARDEKTDIYGVIYCPVNFDPLKKYPIIDKIYTGPHNFFAPKSFWAYRSEAQSFAQLGFIVIEIDGMGTAKRSRDFHNVSYKNLGDGGIDDHIAGFTQLSQKYPYMDLERVGIYGHSAGGYDTVHAMLTHPDFYKVGISSAGNHDHRMDKAWWTELWMGYPVEKHYIDQSNITNAHKLKGKLLLIHGDIDENVNMSCTIQLVDALMKANKDFELLIVPNHGHGLNKSPYFVRKRWDFFVKNLLQETPPKEYSITSMGKK